MFSPDAAVVKNLNEELTAEAYPMIEVPNPNPDHGNVTMFVFRPWTEDDVRKATEVILHPKMKMEDFKTKMANLYVSYRLNGMEYERALRQILGTDWCLISGDWSPFDDHGTPLSYGNGTLSARQAALLQCIETNFAHKSACTAINHCTKRDDERVAASYIRRQEVYDINI